MRRRSQKSFLVIGLGRFGSSLAMSLTRMGHEVLGVDNDEAIVDALRDEIAEVMLLDASNPRAIMELEVPQYDTCVVATGTSLAESILITMHLKEMGARRLVGKAVSDEHARILERIGADMVVFPEADMGERIAHTLSSKFIVDFFEVAPDVSVMEITAPAVFHHRTLTELSLRPRFGVTILGIRRGGQFAANPAADAAIEPGDELLVMGPDAAIEEMLGS
jgi:trk system potassium uptake protein TrkA